MSDRYDTKPTGIGATDDVASGDLPGPGHQVNNQPVVVLEDYPNGTDEGRAMLQIVHDMAPKAPAGFATANSGEVGFANNIRALAGFPTLPIQCRDSKRTSSSTTSSTWRSRSSRMASSAGGRRRRQSGRVVLLLRGQPPGDAGLRLEGADRPGGSIRLGKHEPRLHRRRSGTVRGRLPQLRRKGWRRHRADHRVRSWQYDGVPVERAL